MAANPTTATAPITPTTLREYLATLPTNDLTTVARVLLEVAEYTPWYVHEAQLAADLTYELRRRNGQP